MTSSGRQGSHHYILLPADFGQHNNIEGKENGNEKSYVYDLHDRYDRETNMTSMARTTGYTCTAAANLVIEGKFNRKGICPPEYLGRDKNNFKFILEYLKERGVIFRIR